MATLVSRYKSQFPDVHVSLFEMTVTKQIAALKNEQIDIAFSRQLSSSIADEFISHNIYVDTLVAIVNQGHQLAKNQSINLAQLKNEPFIFFNRDEALGLFDETIMLCKHAGFSPNIISQPTHMQTLVTEVAAGLGVAIGPYCLRKLYSEGCHFIELENVSTHIPVQIQYKHTNNNATVNAFVNIAMNAKSEIHQSMVN